MAAKKKLTPHKRTASRKKAAPRKKNNRRKAQRPVVVYELKKVLVGIAILVSVCLTVAMVADIFLSPGHLEKKKEAVQQPTEKVKKIKPIQEDISVVNTKTPASGLKEKTDKSIKADKPIKYEVFKGVDQTIVEKPTEPIKDEMPKIAIIIDDIGYNKKVALALSDLNSNITFSVLPFSPFGKYICEILHAKGVQLMLHLPMEPIEPDINPGPGAILSSMSPDVLIEQLKKDIKAVPYIVGVNNHMGSKLTLHSDKMNQIFTILKKHHLFFIDSRTASKSQGKASARLLKLRFAQRNIFLDNKQDTEYISGQFKKLFNSAKRHGTAIGIGHPYKITLQTLSKELPKLKNKMEIVRVSSLTSVPE
ncbi:MAG: divergent polysaccharide deacetylase family protein [Desulfobacteraceae bacterium]|nr:divergent polysaccharide deacetylase family protein [Desulfobacteraceae bacterium]